MPTLSAEERILQCFRSIVEHNGSGELRIATKILKRGQKEILINCGKVYRYVIDVGEKQEE